MDEPSTQQYRDRFGVGRGESKRHRDALWHALDIRKFEIDLYWKRAAYFWTFIAAALAGYGGIQAVEIEQGRRQDLTILIASLGIVVSYAWNCANRGSKQWQENWENHVDMLEDDLIGPLYKTVLRRHPISSPWRSRTGLDDRTRLFLTGPSDFSVSKINQIVSLFMTALWVAIVGATFRAHGLDFFDGLLLSLAITTCILLQVYARTDRQIDFEFHATTRGATITPR